MKMTLIIENDENEGQCDFKIATRANYEPAALCVIEALETIHQQMYEQMIDYIETNVKGFAHLPEIDFLNEAMKMKVSELQVVTVLNKTSPIPNQPNDR